MENNNISKRERVGKGLRTLPNSDALSFIEECIKRGEDVKLRVRGNSMAPLLINNLDYVVLRPINGHKIEIGDIIFFRYKGYFLMHRVVELIADNDCFAEFKIVAKGDSLKSCEFIKLRDIVAIVSLPARYTKWWYLLPKRILWQLIKVYIFARGVFKKSDI